ncbi:S1C family serine protease [Akkermansia muciniphila]|uniref:S1C family serine protease n=1 Tax=Akkermansia muciniphila TaxID=239935 RepID=UPI001BFFB5C8|nr:PDZ domain-containing protein [Akkermansia muciniphila]MBT8778013.1 PDZ domain-containing protein [Akkermansia muciniphila]
MKTCIFLTLGLLIGSGSGYSIDRPAGSTDPLQPPPLTPYTPQTRPLPSSRPARLGIVPGTVPQAVVAQLELSGFPGVLVTRIMPDSPAAKAGLKENDVIVKLGDISLSGPQSVTEALTDKVPGDKVTAVFYRKGKRETADITLDGGTLSAEEILAAQGDPRTQPRVVPSVRRQMAPPAGMAGRSALPQRILDMQQMMDDFLKDSAIDDSRMDDIISRMDLTPGAAQMLRSLQGLHQMPMPPMGKVSGGGHSSSSVQMSDAKGTIVVSSSSQTGTTVHVTDASGKVLYSGPYNTQEEKEAVPEAVRERLKHIETNFCF